jgi:hypothetical protein
MPYDPRMLQMARMGIGMMAPPPPPFDRTAPQQPKQWWDQPMPVGKSGGAQSPQDDPSNPDDPNAPKKQPSLFDMMMNLGRMSRPEYDRAIQGPGSYGVAPRDAARVSPWAFLGSLGGGTRP